MGKGGLLYGQNEEFKQNERDKVRGNRGGGGREKERPRETKREITQNYSE